MNTSGHKSGTAAKAKMLNEGNFKDFINHAGKVKVLRFTATWCGPCRSLEPIFEQVVDEIEASASFGVIDIDESPTIANYFSIRSVPTVLVFDERKMSATIVGVNPKSRYVDSIKAVL